MIEHVNAYVIPAAFSFLPANMDSPEARRMLLAIGLQESRFKHRRQIRGPARGYWQFERGGGVMGVLLHGATAGMARAACDALNYRPDGWAVYDALEDNDTLACIFARLLLWTLPDALPTDPEAGWDQYLAAWRPGKPHPETWPAFYDEAAHIIGD